MVFATAPGAKHWLAVDGHEAVGRRETDVIARIAGALQSVDSHGSRNGEGIATRNSRRITLRSVVQERALLLPVQVVGCSTGYVVEGTGFCACLVRNVSNRQERKGLTAGKTGSRAVPVA